MAEQSSAVRAKKPVATYLTSEELALIDREAKERALFSARTTEMRYLKAMQDVLEELTNGDISEGEARKRLMAVLDDFGYSPESGFPDADSVDPAKPGTIEDLSSFGRINLVLDTNAGMAASVARIAEETPDTLDLFPAWRFVRFMNPNGEPRDWQLRWFMAGESVDWKGACQDDFVARKDSPIWQALGSGAGGFTDTLGNPYPPFAFNSGMGWEDVDRDEAKELGLVLDEPVRPERPSLAVTEEEIGKAEENYGEGFADSIYDEIIAELANEERCPVDGKFLRADGTCAGKNHGSIPSGGDGLDEFTRQKRKYEHERKILDEFKASDDHPTCDEVATHGINMMRKDLQRGFTADFGGGHKIVFCLKNLDEKYGDPDSSKFNLGRFLILRRALGMRNKFASISHGEKQIAFIQQGKLLGEQKRIVITTSRHINESGGDDLVARNVMLCDDRYVRREFGFNPA